MVKRSIIALAVVVMGFAGIGSSMVRATSSPQSGVSSLASAIDAILSDPRLSGAQANVVVRSATDGSVLYARNADSRLIPASNDKAYSSAAALEVLGSDYRFATTVASDGVQLDSILRGNLYLKGTGDPTVQAADYDQLAATVAAAGIKKVTGKLVADDTFFDHRQLGNNWAWDNNPFSFQPEISALTVAADSNFDIGSTTVETAPAKTVGKPAQVKTIPATNFLSIQNETTTGPAGSANTIAVERKLGVNTVVVTGSIPLGGAVEDDLSTVSDPTGYAAAIFRDALKRHGVEIVDVTSRGSTPANSHVVVDRKSVPLSQLLTPFLKLSNNGMAEILVKAMGQKSQNQGSWDAGLTAELSALSNLGVDTNQIQLVDGSGLSNLDFTSPTQTTNLLLAAKQKSWFQAWYNALPIAGQSNPLIGGTLSARMRNTTAAGNVHAKTGSLVGVSALSGYVTDADGEQLVFSIMENNFIFGSAKPLEDAIAVDLANFSRNSGVVNSVKLQLQTKSTRTPASAKADGLECSWTKRGCVADQ
jgi:D-alanyl-D-alanine carboxypeptidase/D-alanyl-D-alanine-endopeptidase (penicillin-binding protein 4)